MKFYINKNIIKLIIMSLIIIILAILFVTFFIWVEKLTKIIII
jgi:hypothetical protein